MGRRRNRESLAEAAVKTVVVIVLLLLLAASGGNLKTFNALMSGLFALVIWGVFALAVGVVIFFVIRHFVRKNRTDSSPNYAPPQTFQPPRDPSVPLSFSHPGSWQGPTWAMPEDHTMPSPKSKDVIEKLRSTDWYQFEKVVGLIYQSKGYQLTRRGGANPDGGIDLIVEKNGERAAVQCKRWKKWKVDVPKVRELFGAMTHEGIPRGVIVALNGFTLEAKQLAVEHNIDIVHDENLSVMIEGLTTEDQRKVHAMLDDETKHCPKCEATMIWRMPKAGKKQFTPFWGCSRYPQCYGRLQED